MLDPDNGIATSILYENCIIEFVSRNIVVRHLIMEGGKGNKITFVHRLLGKWNEFVTGCFLSFQEIVSFIHKITNSNDDWKCVRLTWMEEIHF